VVEAEVETLETAEDATFTEDEVDKKELLLSTGNDEGTVVDGG